jgi:mannitol-1-phosphate 5-dehydrogenase
MSKRTFVGFGFGAIQGGLFLLEAHESRNFDRLVVAEVVADVVTAIRRARGTYAVNVATRSGLRQQRVTGIEIFNPNVPADRAALVAAVAEARELATALPSVDFYDRGEASVAAILAEGLARRETQSVLYAGENNNHAAEILERAVAARMRADDAARLATRCQFLDTVIGKMSKVVTDPAEIAGQRLEPVTPDLPRALLVEQFNRILIDQITDRRFQRGITVFEEKPNLTPFEEAKLYGHNATHALLGYLAHRNGYRFMSDIAADPALLELGRSAFREESGAALIHKYRGLDPLFTPTGYAAYVDDLMERMINPHLRDAVERVIRDPRRKLAWDDRLIGTMRLALEAGIKPHRYARGAAAALAMIAREEPAKSAAQLLDELLPTTHAPRKTEVRSLVLQALAELDR